MYSLGQKLKKIRNEKGVTQKTAALQMGIKKSTLVGYELDTREPNIETINKISNYYKIDPSELIKPDLVPNYPTVDLNTLFESEEIILEGKRLTKKEKALIYRIAKAVLYDSNKI